jgi:hypothetical protein
MNIIKILFLGLSLSLFGCICSANDISNADDDRLEMAFRAFASKNGDFPRGRNWEIVKALADPQKGIRFVAKAVDSEGNLLNSSGKPYVFFFSSDGYVIITSIGSKMTLDHYVLIEAKNGKGHIQ